MWGEIGLDTEAEAMPEMKSQAKCSAVPRSWCYFKN